MKITSLPLLLLASLLLSVAPGTLAQSRGEHRLPGIQGQSVLVACFHGFPQGSFCTTNGHPTTIVVQNAAGHYATTLQTDAQGHFRTSLHPGWYTLTPYVNVTTNVLGGVIATFPYAEPMRVFVPSQRVVSVVITYRGAF